MLLSVFNVMTIFSHRYGNAILVLDMPVDSRAATMLCHSYKSF